MMSLFVSTGSIPSRKNSNWLLAAGLAAPIAVAVIVLSVVLTRTSHASHAAAAGEKSAVAAPAPDAKGNAGSNGNNEPMPGDGADKTWKYGGAN